MKNNKYLKELGLHWYDLPGNYSKTLEKSNINVAAADVRNQEDDEGFCSYEFFNLDYTLELIIYSKLCYFREHYATIATPGCFCNEENGNAKWLQTIDKIIEGLKMDIDPKLKWQERDEDKIIEARELFAKYWGCFWY